MGLNRERGQRLVGIAFAGYRNEWRRMLGEPHFSNEVEGQIGRQSWFEENVEGKMGVLEDGRMQ